ncbi:hypothetical protein THAOC_01143 [Thalassiosira oceanica]|uniref:Uncharacterized protein n=1 Tax=Thalassiosira oceanica TaxID=159749 RepID=K0TIY4_THAOC|nr:hypothetical protein THAOC_01143 [Thalassiosira oceanica]|eukprot:EJK77049.1 hypothetical protein THAOC_01143 [Thalassiosira oceanica]
MARIAAGCPRVANRSPSAIAQVAAVPAASVSHSWQTQGASCWHDSSLYEDLSYKPTSQGDWIDQMVRKKASYFMNLRYYFQLVKLFINISSMQTEQMTPVR